MKKESFYNLLLEKGYKTIATDNDITFSNDIYTVKITFNANTFTLHIKCINTVDTIVFESSNLNLADFRKELIELSATLPKNSYFKKCYDDLIILIEDYLITLLFKWCC